MNRWKRHLDPMDIPRPWRVASVLVGFLEAKDALSRDLNLAREAAVRTATDEEERLLHEKIQEVGKAMVDVRRPSRPCGTTEVHSVALFENLGQVNLWAHTFYCVQRYSNAGLSAISLI